MYKSIRISTELHRKLRIYCAEHGMTMSEVIRRALEENKGIVTFKITPNDKNWTGTDLTQTISTTISTNTNDVDIDIKKIQEPSKQLLPCTVPFCKNISKGYYRVTTDAGENTKELWMCGLHLSKAQREGAVIEI